LFLGDRRGFGKPSGFGKADQLRQHLLRGWVELGKISEARAHRNALLEFFIMIHRSYRGALREQGSRKRESREPKLRQVKRLRSPGETTRFDDVGREDLAETDRIQRLIYA
jgi:hypothetical protein